jgi:anti-sigma B factor antagonist
VATVVDFFGAPPFAVTTASYETETRVVVRGEVDVASANTLRRALTAAEEAEGENPIVLDLTGVTFMDSSGLRALIEHVLISSADGDRLRICPSPEVAELLRVAGLTERLATISLEELPDNQLASET